MKQLILALDVVDGERALKIAEETAEFVDRIKVNYPLILSSGMNIIRKLSEIKPVIADFKIADIPYVGSLIAKIAFSNSAEAVIAHGFCGLDLLEELVKVSSEYRGKVYVVTELSSRGGEEFMSQVSLRIVQLAKIAGCHGLVAPSTRIERLKKIREVAGNMEILCPGIGAQQGSLDAVKYADAIIVGRAIYESDDPREAAKKYRELLEL